MANPAVSVLMGSRSDLPVMQECLDTLAEFGVPHESYVLSAHRAPAEMVAYVSGCEARGIQVIVAGAGGAAHLPGMIAATTLLPVLGVPMETRSLGGMDSLLSIVQMPRGVPVGTLAIGGSGATNAALLAIEILALREESLKQALRTYRAKRAVETAERIV